MIPDYSLTISDGVRGVPFGVVAEVTDADYQWSTVAVLRRDSDGALFLVTDAGCSCNGFGDFLTVADLTPLRRFEDALALVDADDRTRLKASRDAGEVRFR